MRKQNETNLEEIKLAIKSKQIKVANNEIIKK